MDQNLRKRLEKQHYAIVGNHSGVKLCHWLKQSLIHKRHCYKQDFYGIQSHRCLQMTPAINHCTHSCLFCWRYQGFTENYFQKADDPNLILQESINAQQQLITGFKGDDRCNINKWNEANHPNMVACSLSGEPTLYPHLGDFFEACHRKKMTTFLVTNGTTPEILEKLDPLPKQLYVSLVSPNKDVYKKLCNPFIKDGWNKINQTLELLSSLETRTVIRHTLIKKWNMNEKFITDYASLIKKATPHFIEPKGFVLVGDSRKRLTLSNMPSHEDIQEFSKKLAQQVGYERINEKPKSRVVLLSSNEREAKIIKQD